jgi:tripartite-type tricarboxylate transporter receptor subunit TctC
MILGTKLKVITGYPSASDIVLAMQAGELMGGCGVDSAQLYSQFGTALKEGKIRFVMQASLKTDERYKDVPNVLDFAPTPEARTQLETVLLPGALGKAIALPPEVPADRVAMIRDGFNKAMNDAAFKAEMDAAMLDIRWMDAGEVTQAVERFYTVPPSSVELIRSLLKRG